MIPKLTDDSANALQNEYSILHLIYHRNKNQHRASVWWKYLNMIHRHVRKILQSYYAKSPSAELERLLVEFKRRKILHKAYWEFNSIIALGQFVTLGMTLIGVLAKISSILEPSSPDTTEIISAGSLVPSASDTRGATASGSQLAATNYGADDLGEEISEELLHTLDSSTSKRTHTPIDIGTEEPMKKKKKTKPSGDSVVPPSDLKPVKKKKKSKKKRNDIDDIFG